LLVKELQILDVPKVIRRDSIYPVSIGKALFALGLKLARTRRISPANAPRQTTDRFRAVELEEMQPF
jgi:hypothetical protein